MVRPILERQEAFDGRPRLTEAVCGRCHTSLQTLTALPSNIEAIEAGMRFADGTHPLVAIAGPSGWGKSHLLAAVADHMNRTAGESAVVVSAMQWLRYPSRSDALGALLVDDVQDVLGQPRATHVFRQHVDLRFRTGRRTMLAWNMTDSARRVKSLLPSLRQWYVVEIREPSLNERELVVLQIASRMKLKLSLPIARLAARHLHGNARSIEGALQRLSLIKQDWSAPTDVMPACGVLSPYLLGHNGWDPRDHVFEAVVDTLSTTGCPLQASEVASYFMLNEMGLSETEVASFLRVSPSAAYVRARKVKESLDNQAVRPALDACRIAVLEGFEEDRP